MAYATCHKPSHVQNYTLLHTNAHKKSNLYNFKDNLIGQKVPPVLLNLSSTYFAIKHLHFSMTAQNFTQGTHPRSLFLLGVP